MFQGIMQTQKPVIAMVHFPPLPGCPLHDSAGGVGKLYDSVARDVEALVEGGVDAVMFCNEGDRPYVFKADPVVTSVMAAVISRIVDGLPIPFGVDVLWDPEAAIGLAKATGGKFVREIFTGVYVSDMGLWNTSCGATARYRQRIGAMDVKLFFNINGEFAAPLATRPLNIVAKSVVFSSLADGICVSGPMTGQPTSLKDLIDVKNTIPNVPVIANTGVNINNVAETLEVADAVIVGTSLKHEGITWNAVDVERVRRFMAVVHDTRARMNLS